MDFGLWSLVCCLVSKAEAEAEQSDFRKIVRSAKKTMHICLHKRGQMGKVGSRAAGQPDGVSANVVVVQ